MSRPNLHILGIRHHGPGSAASAVAALDAIDPQVVLIEGPADANDVIGFAGMSGMRPPLAILVHDQDDPSQSVFYPLAEFSPEWQAIRWALARGRPVRFIDIPAGLRLHSHADLQPAMLSDPLTVLAEAAGESDGESWWNGLVEQSSNGPEVFHAIAQAMTALRASFLEETPLPPLESLREAHMRIEIGKALAETSGGVAVVCGAWHVPALAEEGLARQDAALLKGHKAAKTEATWVPWTDSRLAALSGYGAGVISPGWYRHLWDEFHRQGSSGDALTVAARWQTRVAGLLRGEGIAAAAAASIEAARLALSLAAVRGFPLPGLGEMQDASLSVMCHGDEILLRLIASRLVIGGEIGEIDDGIPQMPLAQDLKQWLKRLRLKQEAIETELAVDLRSEAGLLKSALLHRLLLLGVPWGRLVNAQAGRGTFREVWQVLWVPELSVKLAEALRFGTTIEQAAGNAALAASAADASLGRCAQLIGQCLNADIPGAAEMLTTRLQALSVNSNDLAALMLAAPPLINVLRYGTARKIPREALAGLVSGLAAEVCAGLVVACRGLNAEGTQAMFAAMKGFDDALPLLDDPYFAEAWLQALATAEADQTVSPFLRGFALRRLYDGHKRSVDETAVRMAHALSRAQPVQDSGFWLEGFLSHAAQVLLHDHALFGLIDHWLSALPEESFIELLPMLRRSISSFDSMERRRILEQVRLPYSAGGPPLPSPHGAPETNQGFAKALPLLKLILGIDDDR